MRRISDPEKGLEAGVGAAHKGLPDHVKAVINVMFQRSFVVTKGFGAQPMVVIDVEVQALSQEVLILVSMDCYTFENIKRAFTKQ